MSYKIININPIENNEEEFIKTWGKLNLMTERLLTITPTEV